MALENTPLLPVMGVGSYAAPGWFIAFQKKIRDGSVGEVDIQEALDAVSYTHLTLPTKA